MKKISVLLLILLFSASIRLHAQQIKIQGIVTDKNTSETIPGVSIMIDGTSEGTVSRVDGTFELAVTGHNVKLQFTHISYNTLILESGNQNTNTIYLGTVALEPKVVELNEVRVISSFVSDRNTPVAVTNIRAHTIEQKLGNQDYPEILKMTPGVYATREGGGSGDDRLSLRGFQQENVSLLLNGVPVSSMENGLVYWSNWTGLADATEAIQVQRGLGASKVAMNSVGGTINIITRSASAEAGGVLRYSLSDCGNSKTILSFSTGKMKNGAALTFLGSHTVGPGFVDATFVNGWSYFLSIDKPINKKHRLVLTAMGSPERHGQRNYGMSQADFEKFGVKYNSNWGEYNGEILSLSENFYHKPQINLNHYFTIGKKASLSSSAYVSWGKGGGRYTEAYNYGPTTWTFQKNNQIDFDQVFLNNSTHTDSAQLADGTVVKGYSKNILTNYLADHYWIGLLSSLNLQLNDNLKLTSGIHLRNFRSHLYEVVGDLMGGTAWIEQYAWSLAGVNGRNQVKNPGDVVNVDNYSMISYGNLFSQLEYNSCNITAFIASTLSGTHYCRKDTYNYPDSPKSEPVNKAGFDIKSGISYKAGKSGSIYGNIGYYSREPYYKFVYVNYSNAVAQNLVNEKISAAEAGYTYESGKVATRLNLYCTLWKDKSLLSNENIQLIDSSFTRSLVRGLNAIHSGIEAEMRYNIIRCITVAATVSLGNWKWQNDVTASLYDNNHVLADSIMIYTKGLYVGDAPQTQIGISGEYHSVDSFSFSADWVYYNRLYASFDPANRNNADDRSQPYRIPSYSLLDLYAGYDFHIKELPVSLQLACQNIFGRQTIIRGEDGASHDLDTFRGFWSLGRTFNMSAKLSF